MGKLLLRIAGKYQRVLAYRFRRRMTAIKTSVPIISFTFDDAPRSAFSAGGDILKSHGVRATFYVSLGLLGSHTEAGVIASSDDLLRAIEDGNELGCHTYDHVDTWRTPKDKLMESILKNRQALSNILPETKFTSFAYPKSDPTPAMKYQLEKYFDCCRGGGQTPNIGMADLNLLKACFLDKRTNIDITMVNKIIDYNSLYRGWLIFATHDVTDDPSPYGCTRKFFGEVVQYAVRSGALILPVGKALEKLRASNSESSI